MPIFVILVPSIWGRRPGFILSLGALYHGRIKTDYAALARFAQFSRTAIASFPEEEGVKMADKLSGAAILFDLDGTLVDTVGDLAASMNYALAGSGFAAVPAENVRNLVGRGARRMLMRGYEIAAGRDASESELDAALARFLEHYEANIAVLSRPFDGVVEMIERLRSEGAKIAICTNKREAMAQLLIETLGLAPLFDAIVGADTAAAPKPDAAPVLMCMTRTSSERGVFVGDSDTDIKAATAASMPCLIADFGYGPLTLARQASAVFSDYGAAAELIRAELRRT